MLQTLPKDKRGPSDAVKGVAYCDKLFHLEKQFALLFPEERLKERERLSKPLVEEFYTSVGSLHVLSKTLMGRAAYYAASQREYLERYLLDGRLEISNNRAENLIRPLLWGAKTGCFPTRWAARELARSITVSLFPPREMGLCLLNT
jgi:hypothetical protein